MGRRRSENVLQFKKIFLVKRRGGLSVKEIAEQCHISTTYGYHLLQEIADENGMTREEVLGKNKKANHYGCSKESNQQVKKSSKKRSANSEQIQLACLEILEREMDMEAETVNRIINKIDDMLVW